MVLGKQCGQIMGHEGHILEGDLRWSGHGTLNEYAGEQCGKYRVSLHPRTSIDRQAQIQVANGDGVIGRNYLFAHNNMVVVTISG
ncbi:unnamed protein product [Brassica napus]|uniref:(rape) hypothetical protein n=1 Tax=Brassica napus TaxID=3708 RepID=A0A816IXD7_BRANA|nr:unnamed protein product [Brassica napus]